MSVLTVGLFGCGGYVEIMNSVARVGAMVSAVTLTVLCVVWVVDIRVSGDSLPDCTPADFHFKYTECDSEGGRWRVSVPKKNTCKDGAPNLPVRGKDCTFACSPGQYLDLSGDQTCQPCPAGTYSLGGGVRFDDWEKLPESFSSTSEELGSSFLTAGQSRGDNKNCSRSLQVEKGGDQPAECITAVPGFQTVCLDPDVLETAYHQYKQEHGQMRTSTEEKYRYIGYRQLVRWCFGILGRNIRVPLPSCCVHKIREHFQSEKYRGFQWPELD